MFFLQVWFQVHFLQQINKQKSKKFQNKMQLVQHLQIQQNREFNFNSLELSSLFLHTKKLTKQLESLKKIKEKQSNGEIEKCRKQVRQVLQFIVQKITNNKKLKIDQFVALVSIFVYINVALEAGQKIGIHFSEHFYENIERYIEKVVTDWNEGQVGDSKGNSSLNLSILLCCLSSIIQQSAKNICNLSYCKLFSTQNLKQILSLRLPNEEKFVKHYKNLVLYFNKLNFSMGIKKKFMKSLSYSLLNYSDYKNMQLTSIFLLNKCLQDEKFIGKLSQIWQKNQLDGIIQACVNLMLNEKEIKPVQMKLIMEFCLKIVSKISEIDEKVINVRIFLKIFNSLNKQMSQPDRLHVCLQSILSKMSGQNQQQIMKRIISEQKQPFSTIHLQFLEITSKKIQSKQITKLIESGYWEQILFLLQETSMNINLPFKNLQIPNGQSLNYRKYLLSRIINNILKNSQENSDIWNVLNNLYELITGVCEKGQF